MRNKNMFTAILSLCVASSCLLSVPLFAETISNTVSPDIIEPANTYDKTGAIVVNMAATTVIETGACITGSYTGCTLNDVLNDIDSRDDFKPEIKVHMVADDFLDDGKVFNAKLRQRGATSRGAPQKSFRIKLESKKELWRGERRIQLLKSFFDLSRVRNKLSYDLFSEIPHLPSMRTQFVHLKIDNPTVTDPLNSEDYGLFTAVEHFGKEYLQRRGWDKDSRVYKIEVSTLKLAPELAIDPLTGKPINPTAFEKKIEIKRGKTHFDFANMLKDLNDLSVDFNTQIMGKYFNRDNYLTWFAVNILLGSMDTVSHNYYLFNPKGNSHFYFVPWDYDASLGIELDFPSAALKQLPRWWFSHNNWDTVLHRRFLSVPGNLDLLKAAVLEIKNKYLSEAQIKKKADKYHSSVFSVINGSPDWDKIWLQGNGDPELIAEYNRIYGNLHKSIEFHYSKFIERINDPSTFYMDEPTFLANHDILFGWSESKSWSNQTIIYDLEVSTTKEFKAGTIIRTIKNIADTQYLLNWTHPKGTYFLRLRSRDAANPQNHWQDAGNEDLFYHDGDRIFGVIDFTVTTDGGVTPGPVVSNPISIISINGDKSDWNGLTLFANDPDDVPTGNTNIVDWRNAGIAHNSQDVYFLYDNRAPFDSSNTAGTYFTWGWQAFLDTDNNPSTGFQHGDALGADYLISATTLHRYNGTGTDWNWTTLTDTTSKFSNNIAELSFPRNLIGNPSSIRVIFDGTNTPFGGSTTDIYPDGVLDSNAAVRYFSYSFGGVVNPTNHAPVAKSQNLSLIQHGKVGIALEAIDADNDPITLEIVQIPSHGTLSYSFNSLSAEYKPDQNYTGSDSFKFKVSDGKDDSNIATVTLTVNTKPPSSIISNHVIKGGISVNGISSDWNNLTLFADDPDDIPAGASNVIDWQSAGLAHSKDTVYLLYKNRGNVDPNGGTGTTMSWGWQTYIDIDNDGATGFNAANSVGAEYLIEGRHIYQYAGNNNSSWDWVEVGVAIVKYNNGIAELSFPRNLLSSHGAVKVAFVGSNRPFGSNSADRYPEHGGFAYNFGSGQFGRSVKVSKHQIGIVKSDKSHDPSSGFTEPGKSKPKGGSLHWLIFFVSIVLLRKKLKLKK